VSERRSITSPESNERLTTTRQTGAVRNLGLVVVAALVVATSAAASTAPLVPAFVQGVVKSRAGALAYVPTRSAFGYRYAGYDWNARTKVLSVRLHDKHYALSNANRTVVFTARWLTGQCSDGNEKSYQVDGNKVFSAGGGDIAWRCVRGRGERLVRLQAAGQNLPAAALAIVVSSGKRIT
jgi:hypothetical protein